MRSRSLINFKPAALNPKRGLFVLAFIPQFVNPSLGSVTVQMMVYGAWFAALTALGFALMGIFATRLSTWLQRKPKVVNGLNVGAGLTFVASGLSVAALSQK